MKNNASINSFNIGNIQVGGDALPLVIPEIGINHNGSLKVAKQMVKSAFEAGAKIIKHQTHIIDDEMSPHAKSIKPGNSNNSIYQIMKEAALSFDEELELKDYTESLGMVFLSTPFSRAAADRLEKMGVLAYKIGSGELNNYPLIDYIASFGKPMIISTGMNNIENIKKTVKIVEKHSVPYALMHTTNLYPTPVNLVRLGAMQELMREFPKVPIGLSDHTLNNNACIAALALNAKIVERHYTDSKKRIGPDIVCSMDRDELEMLIQASRDVPKMLGGTKEASSLEEVTMKFAFASVVSIADIKAGEVLSNMNIWVKRPGTGELSAEKYTDVLGCIALEDIPKDTQIEKRMIK